MQLNVSARIFGGFALVLILAGGIFIAGLLAINSINQSVQNVTSKSVPMLVGGANYSNSLLESQISLTNFFNAERLDLINSAKNDFDSKKQINSQIKQQLLRDVVHFPSLKKVLTEANNRNEAFFSSANLVTEKHSQAINALSNVEEMATEFSDMGDEILSYSYDAEGLASSESSVTLISDFTLDMENTVEEANAALSATIKFEVLNIKSVITENINDLETKLTALGSDKDLGQTDELVAINEAFVHFKSSLIGSDNVLDAKISVLELKVEAKASLANANQNANDAIAAINTLKDEVSKQTAVIEGNAADTVTTSRAIIIVFAIIALLVSITTAVLVTRSIRNPLNSAVKQLKQAATGDLTVEFEKESNDELGELSDNMQDLVTNMRDIVKKILVNSQMLATTAEHSTTISLQSLDNVSEQKQQTEMMVSSMAEMVATIESVSQSINNTLNQVEGAHTEVNDGEKLLTDNISSINKLSDEIESAASVISQLNNETNNISSVLDVIRGVAEQTNLLALNAAIEAARAGEQGRGFAVVADEVRTLASRAHDSTAEIQGLIERLLNGAEKAVTTMDHSKQETSSCVIGINDVGSMLSSIAKAITAIKDTSQQIASAAEQQSIAAQSQNDTVVQIAELAEQTSESAKENQQASHDLASMAETQRELVNQFKV